MKTILIVVLTSIVIPGALVAQTAEDKKGVERALLDYVEGFYEGDSSKIIRSTSPEVAKYGYWKDKKSGKYRGEPMSYQQMINYAVEVKTKNHQAKPNSIKRIEILEVQDQIACGKITAWWGFDYILLEKVNNKWMIRMVLWQGPLP